MRYSWLTNGVRAVSLTERAVDVGVCLIPWLRRLATAIATPFVALALLFEEWGWSYLAAVAVWLGRLPVLRQAEHWVTTLSPRAAMCLFAAPAIALLPVKLVALWLFGSGHAASGIALLVAAKLAGTAVVARLFALTQPALMQLGWFARWYPRWKNWKDSLLAQVRSSAPWQAAGRTRQAVHRRFSTWWSRMIS